MSPIYDLFREYYAHKNEIVISVSQMKKNLGDMINKIVLYGAGSAGVAFLRYLRDAGIYPKYFADGDGKRWYSNCEDIEVIPPEEIVRRVGEECLVIITINTDGVNYCRSFAATLRKGGPGAVYKRLHEAGCKNVVEYTAFRRCIELYKNDKYNLPSCSDVYKMEEHAADIEQIYNMFSDDVSRETYYKIVKFRILDDSVHIPTFEQRQEYFDYSLYTKRSDEVFIDCGAYSGTTLDVFLENNKGEFAKYYAIEPDECNYQELADNCRKKDIEVRKRIMLVKAAVYDEAEKEISFYSLGGPGSFVCADGESLVRTISIDSLLAGNEATFIKMNIEGSEKAALRGSEATIYRYRPVLAIMGYHKTWDLWEVPQIIKKIVPDYQIYLRSYMNHISFMYYAVPRERIFE